MDWETFGYVKASRIRKEILLSLKEKHLLPSELTGRLNIDKSQVTRALKELEDKGLVKCVTPLNKKGRLYSITDKGKTIVIRVIA